MDEFAALTANYADTKTVHLREALNEKVKNFRKAYPTIPTDNSQLRKLAIEAVSIIVMMAELLDRQSKQILLHSEKDQHMVRSIENMVTVLEQGIAGVNKV